MDWLTYQLSRIPEVAAWPVGLATAAGISLLPATRIPGWIRLDLSAIYLPPLLVFAFAWGPHFPPQGLAENVTGTMLASVGLAFSVFRYRHKECELSGVVFGGAFLIILLLSVVCFNRYLITLAGP